MIFIASHTKKIVMVYSLLKGHHLELSGYSAIIVTGTWVEKGGGGFRKPAVKFRLLTGVLSN
jgi:hypothetical protein